MYTNGQPISTFEDLVLNIDVLHEITEKDKITLLKEKIWHINYFLKQKEVYTEKLKAELELCERLLEELLGTPEF